MRRSLGLAAAVFAGLVAGSVVNGAVIQASGHFIAPPAGADVSSVEGLKAALPLLAPRHFLFPFVAHSLGTLVGAWLATRLTPARGPAYVVGGLFLLAGIANVLILPAPLWFEVLDLVAAYLPFAWLGTRLACPRATTERARA